MSAIIKVIDIETKPYVGYFWGLWKQNIALNQIKQEWEILTYASKVFRKPETLHLETTEHDEDERRILSSLWDELDEADIIVAHNGDRFDVARINAKLLKYGFPPYSPIKVVDTLKALRSRFALPSNRLDFVSKYLGFEGKLATGGMQLWIDCMEGDPKAWEKMGNYNKEDVLVLEDVYEKILPWITNHPNVGVYNDENTPVCPKCGGTHFHYRGYSYTSVGKYRRFQCLDCGGWGKTGTNELPKEKRQRLIRNVPK